MKKIVLLLLSLCLALAGCQGGSPAAGSGSGSATAGRPLRVGASPVPHGEILAFVRDNLAKDAGLQLEVVEFSDYVQPNAALADKSLDANYFQHRPYLDAQVAQRGYQFAVVTPVHLEPLGIYSRKARALDALPNGATIAIPNDPSNAGRALTLLAAKGVLTLTDTGGKAPTVADVASSANNVKVTEVEAAQLPRSLDDVDAAVINGNYAIPAGLDPAKGALALEEATGNPYANLLVARQDNATDPRVVELGQLLCSQAVADFIKSKYAGAVAPACPRTA